MAKIVPLFGNEFNNWHAFLASLAEQETVVGFCGFVTHANGELRPVAFNAEKRDIAYAALLLQYLAVHGEEDPPVQEGGQ